MAVARTRSDRAPLASVEELVADIRRGKMVILIDDEDRENEGDLTMAAEKVTPAAINFMAKHGRGSDLPHARGAEGPRPRPAADGLGQHRALRDGLHGLHRGAPRRDHRHLGRGPRDHDPRGHRAGGPPGRPGAPRAHLPAQGGPRRRAAPRRPDRGLGRSRAPGGAGAGGGDLRDHERRRHDGAPPRPAGSSGASTA